MRICFLRIYVLLLLSISLASTEVTIENGGYNVLVAFSQNMPSKKGIELIGEIEISLQEASQILHKAIGLRISKVTFDIPESWNVSRYNRTVEVSFNGDFAEADILIDDITDTVFGKFPFAQQYGGCGIPSYQVIVPTAFFDSSNNFPKGMSLAREWLKYRYGVFDENGYIEDPIYPQYYKIPGGDANEVLVTHCTNSEITYNFTQQKTDEECPSDEDLIKKLNDRTCKSHVNEDNLDSITSSFMYFEESIPKMTDICGKDHEHKPRFPSKQNVLCSGKSIWDVITLSNDTKNEEEQKEYAEIEFVFSMKAKPRVVVAWENTETLKSQGKIILNSIKKLMIDLPNGSKFQAFPFQGGSKKKYKLEDLIDVASRKKIDSELKLDFDRTEEVNLKSQIKKAIAILKAAAENSPKPPGNVIIITGTQDNIIVVLLKDLHVCIKTFDQSSFTEKGKLESDLPCLEVVRIPLSDEPEAVYEKLTRAMENILLPKEQDKFTELLKVEYINQSKPMEVPVDDFTESITFSIFTDKMSDRFKLTIDGKEEEEPKEDNYASDVLVLHYPNIEAGDYTFSYSDPSGQSTLVEVKTTSKMGKYFSGKIGVVDTTNADDNGQMPVIIYAIVRFGSYPVQNAKVSAVIQKPGGEEDNLDLNDDGRGDPDITMNDGVYSRYFTNFNSEGEYTVTVTITNDEIGTKYGLDSSAGYTSCCGSSLNGGAETLKPFTKVIEKTFKAIGARPDDGYKPSRITDLRIGNVTDDEIILEWTAPGGEADSGSVQSYEVKSFTSPDEAKNNFESGGDLLNYTSFLPKERGETQELKIRFSDFERTGENYIAMKARNAHNKKSDISMILEVHVSDRETTDAPDNEDGRIKKAQTNPKTIGLIVGLIVGLILLMILIYVVIYFVIVKPKRKKEQKENVIYEPTAKKTENNVLNPISFVSADTLIKHHNEKLKAKSENKKPPVFNEEDFEDRNYQPTNESSTSSNDQEQESSNKNPRNGRPFPPKSPKRITPV